MEDFRKAMYDACLQMNIPIIGRDTAAKILAVVYIQGCDERIVLSPKVKADLEYIQNRFDIHGGETMDASLQQKTKWYVKDLEQYIKTNNDWPTWVYDFWMERYNFKLYKP